MFINLNIDLNNRKIIGKSMTQAKGMIPKIIFIGISLVLLGAALPFVISSITTVSHRAQSNPGNEGFHLRGNVDLVLYDKDGSIKDERHIDNMIVDSGFEGIASRIAPHDGAINPSSPYNYIGLGTSSTAASAAQTSLVSELPTGSSYSRQQDSQATYLTTSGKQLILSVVFPQGQATGTINESGLFNASTGGDMLARQTFSTINKGASDTLTVTWTITLSTTP